MRRIWVGPMSKIKERLILVLFYLLFEVEGGGGLVEVVWVGESRRLCLPRLLNGGWTSHDCRDLRYRRHLSGHSTLIRLNIASMLGPRYT